MKRTTVSLPDELADALAHEARRRNVSASEVARDALSKQLGLTDAGPRDLPFAALGRSGHRSTGRDMEDLLVEEWHDEARDR